MLYFKKADLAETYHISEKTVTNWIKAAKLGKLNLELHEEYGRAWIANTTRNISLVEELVEGHRKYRNSHSKKTISPKPGFYALYGQRHAFEISSNLDMYREIPYQYDYFGEGAEYWDGYAQRLAAEDAPNFLNMTIKQLRINYEYIDNLLANYKRVNVVDIGVGNAMPVRGLLQHLLDQKKLGRYIAVDISPSMLGIARRNIKRWFGAEVQFESFEADINYDRFASLLAEEALGDRAQTTANLILALGGTFANLRSPDNAFKVIHDSMGRNDLFVYNLKLDSKVARQYFDFAIGKKLGPLDAKSKVLMDLLNIDESFYDVEIGFDGSIMERYVRMRLKVNLTLVFNFENGERTVELNKNDTILLWRYWHLDPAGVAAQMAHNGFYVLHTSQTRNREYLLSVAEVCHN